MGTNSDTAAVDSIKWCEDHIRILDQTYLPTREVYSDIRDVGRTWEAIKKLRVCGTSAVGIVTAYGFYLGIKELPNRSFQSFMVEAERIAEYLESARSAAVHSQWVLERLKTTIRAHKEKDISEIKDVVLKTAKTIHAEDERNCKKVGEHGVELVSNNDKILTHSNTGSLATGQYGTALSIIYQAHKNSKDIQVWVDETRPLLQGSRLTAWELINAEIPMKLIADAAAGSLLKRKEVDLVIVGADRIAANGDTVNKIGTYPLAVLAKENDIPFYVAAPLSTIDMNLENGEEIPVEERDGEEITAFNGSTVAPKKADTYNPAFDTTPAKYITAFITEKGITEPPFNDRFKKLMGE